MWLWKDFTFYFLRDSAQHSGKHIISSHLNHFFDAINGTRQQAADLFVVIHVIRVSHTHEEYVRR